MEKLKEASVCPINIKTIAEGKVDKEARVYWAGKKIKQRFGTSADINCKQIET